MRLDQLLGAVDVLELRGSPEDVEVRSITHDASAVTAGALFCCLRGSRADGHDFAPEAARRGASALLCERVLELDLAQARVADARAAMAPVAAAFHGHPSQQLRVVGITGTNGKTTVAHLLQAILEANEWPTGVIGTLSGARTTPDAPALQAELARFRDEGRVAVAMEVSSHALVQHRVDAVRFAVGVFTNLSQDHLDYHGTMDAYFEAKASLFRPDRVEVAVINADDPAGRRLLERGGVRTVRYSMRDAGDVEVTAAGSAFDWHGTRVHLSLGGRLNVANALAAATAARELGVDASTVAAGLGAAGAIPGRFERVDAGQPFTVVVDFAHTPDGLEQALRSAREIAGAGRVLVVFGSGGDRDRAKRPLMGEVAGRLADRVVVTSDNPRSEDPLAIIDEVRRGVARPDVLVVEPDRAAAIERALAEARPGDVVLVAGKGHETGQETAGRIEPFDDRDVARRALAQLVGGAR